MEKIALKLAEFLDKLKLNNPILFVILQALLVALAGLLENGAIVLPSIPVIDKIASLFGASDLNGFVTGILVILVALNGVHTSKRLKSKENA